MKFKGINYFIQRDCKNEIYIGFEDPKGLQNSELVGRVEIREKIKNPNKEFFIFLEKLKKCFLKKEKEEIWEEKKRWAIVPTEIFLLLPPSNYEWEIHGDKMNGRLETGAGHLGFHVFAEWEGGKLVSSIWRDRARGINSELS